MIFTCVSDVNGINGPSFFFESENAEAKPVTLWAYHESNSMTYSWDLNFLALPKRTSDVFRHVLNADPDNHH